MMYEWQINPGEIRYFFLADGEVQLPDDDSGLPRKYMQAVGYQLMLRILSDYNLEPLSSALTNAHRSYEALLTDTLVVPSNGIKNGAQCIIEFMNDAPVLDFRLVGGNYHGDLYFSLGYNDGFADIERVKAAFPPAVAVARRVCPLAKIIVTGPATPVGAMTQLDAIRAAMAEMYASMGIAFVDVRNRVNAANKGLYTDRDRAHPSDVGHVYRGV